jgi:hypothetical protein
MPLTQEGCVSQATTFVIVQLPNNRTIKIETDFRFKHNFFSNLFQLEFTTA